MKGKTRVLIAGRNEQELEEIGRLLGSRTDLALSKRHITNGHSDPLYNMAELPDALVFCTTTAWETELASLDERPPSRRVPTVVTGQESMSAMRTAMRVGARDYFSFPVQRDELVEAMDRIIRELQPAAPASGGITAVIDAKGGSGASTLAAALAHGLADRMDQKVALLDMDLQFGHLASLFDLPEAGSLVDAIVRVDTMDAVALEGHMVKHKSGLHLLGNNSERLIMPGDIEETQLQGLMALLRVAYGQVVIDLPRQVDGINGLILETADRILMVVQQSVSHMQDARRMMRYFTHYMGIPLDQVSVVINRWDKRLALTTNDIEKALGVSEVTCIPNDFSKVAESANLGIPLLEVAPSSPVSRSVLRLAESMTGKKPAVMESGFGRVLRKLAGA